MKNREEYKQTIISDLKSDGPYCCYCCQPQEGKLSCCSENHFIDFGDLYEEDQKAMIDEQLFDLDQYYDIKIRELEAKILELLKQGRLSNKKIAKIISFALTNSEFGVEK